MGCQLRVGWVRAALHFGARALFWLDRVRRGFFSLAEGGVRSLACLGGVGCLAVLAGSAGFDWPLAEMILGWLFALPGVNS